MTLAEKLLNHVKLSCGCWIWLGAQGNHEYGVIRVPASIAGKNSNRIVTTHRQAYIEANGSVPEGKEVMHTCDIKACVNPDHLVAGTHKDNMNDAAKRGLLPHKLTADDVRAIRADPRTDYAIAKEYGINQGVPWQIRNGRTWKHVK